MTDDAREPVELATFIETIQHDVAEIASTRAAPLLPGAVGAGRDIRPAALDALAEQLTALQGEIADRVSALALFVEEATAVTRRSTTEQIASIGESQTAMQQEVAALRASVEQASGRLETIDVRLNAALEESSGQTLALEQLDHHIVATLAEITAALELRLGDGPSLPELLAVFSEANEQAYVHALETASAQLAAQLSHEMGEIAVIVRSLGDRRPS
jgi:chromosome segregation ATPase